MSRGDGKIHGIDVSPAMVTEAIRTLSQEIAEEKIELTLGDAAHLPYRDNSMDRIFHTNCYYFWPDQLAVAKELFRVLKPQGFMVTLVDLRAVKEGSDNGYLKYGNGDPEPYMNSLRDAGFVDTKMETNTEGAKQFECIMAYKP